MKYHYLILLLAGYIVLSAESCENTTILNYQETLNFLDVIQPPFTPNEGKRITGFVLSMDPTAPTAVIRRYSTRSSIRILEGAGSETPPCNDGTSHLRALNEPLIRIIDFIGDTGGDDVSDDGDCRCDTHIRRIDFQPIEVHFEDGTNRLLTGRFIDGRYTLCPNIPEGHLTRGDREFGGGVTARFQMTLRVSDDNMSLLADVAYDVEEI